MLRAAIEAEKDRISVEPYVTASMHQGLIGHARGFWAGTLMGLASGALTGGIIGSRIGSSAGAIGGAMAS